MIGVINTPLCVPNDQKWTTDGFRFWQGQGRTIPLNLTSMTAYLRTPLGERVDLNVVVDGNEGVIEHTAEFMAALVPGEHGLEVQYTDENDDTRQIRGVVRIKGPV